MNTRWAAFSADELRMLLLSLMALGVDSSLPEEESRIAERLRLDIKHEFAMRGQAARF